MGRLVYISVPNYLNTDLVGTEIPISALFQGIATEIRNLLLNNGVDAYIASSAVKDVADRYNESIDMRSECFIHMDVSVSGNCVEYDGSYYDSIEMGSLISKKLSKINRKHKFARSSDLLIGPSDVPFSGIAFKYNTIEDSRYLIDHSDDIAYNIARSICSYFGIKWNYRPSNISEDEYIVYVPPVNNQIKARTIASMLKKNSKINSKVI